MLPAINPARNKLDAGGEARRPGPTVRGRGILAAGQGGGSSSSPQQPSDGTKMKRGAVASVRRADAHAAIRAPSAGRKGQKNVRPLQSSAVLKRDFEISPSVTV